MSDGARVPTGIPGFDGLIEGGFLRGRSVVLSGPAGSGKTTFGMQYLYNGAAQYGESGVFVTLEEEADDLAADQGRYGWDLDGLRRENRLAIVTSPVPFEVNGGDMNIDTLLDVIHATVVAVNAKRIVFDSIAALGLSYREPVLLRRDVLRLGAALRDLGCTSLLLTEASEGGYASTRYGVEQFLAHGVVILHSTPAYRSVQVSKMRGTRHDMGIHLMRMTEKGIVITPGESPL
jgi:KaiC/GvpD/RAD55 family RecA-like ATPase